MKHVALLEVQSSILEPDTGDFYFLYFRKRLVMAFPEPKPQVPQLPQHLLRTIDCQQGAVRAVRFNGEKELFKYMC